MNAVRIRKENQIYSAEEKRALQARERRRDRVEAPLHTAMHKKLPA